MSLASSAGLTVSLIGTEVVLQLHWSSSRKLNSIKRENHGIKYITF